MKQLRVYSVCFWALFSAISVFFLIATFHRAGQKTFWQDEQFGFKDTVRNQPISELILEGASGQASLAPLDYLFLKALDSLRRPIRYLGLAPSIYFRLVAFLSTLVSTWLIGFMAWRSLMKDNETISPFQFILVLFGLFAYLFTANTYNYSVEMRPYSLWNALWFLIGSLFLYYPEKKSLIFLLLLLLGLTSSGSIFQFVALGATFFLMNTVLGNPWKKNLKVAVLLFLPPFLLALKYCRVTGDLGTSMEGQTWGTFLLYMITNEHVPILTVLALVLCFLNRESWKVAFPSLALLILYCMGPLVYFSTRSRGMFFADRQYIYYSTAIPFFFFIASKIYPIVIKKMSKPVYRHGFVMGLCILMLTGYVGYLHGRVKMAKDHFYLREPFGFFKDDQGQLAAFLKNELPESFCVDSDEYRSGLMFGLGLLGEWMPVHYKNKAIGSKTVFVGLDKDMPYVSHITIGPCSSGQSVKVGRDLS